MITSIVFFVCKILSKYSEYHVNTFSVKLDLSTFSPIQCPILPIKCPAENRNIFANNTEN
jgi:hypothetical protein